ncbi:helix-turn-helix domain-containing protein [Nocardia asteroides]
MQTPEAELETPVRQRVRAGHHAGSWLEILQAPERNGLTVTEVCRRYEVSRKSYYSYLARYRAHGEAGLAPRSRRPKHLPARTAPDIEAVVVRTRLNHPRWGARRIRAQLLRANAGHVPAVSTVHAILRRHGLVGPSTDHPAPPTKEPAMTTPRTPDRAGSVTR